MRRCLSRWQLRFRLLLLPLLGCSDDKSVDPATARIEACVRAQEEYLSLLSSSEGPYYLNIAKEDSIIHNRMVAGSRYLCETGIQLGGEPFDEAACF